MKIIYDIVNKVFETEDVVLPSKTHQQIVHENLLAEVRKLGLLQRCCEFISKDPDPLSQNLISAITAHRKRRMLTWEEKASIERIHEIVKNISGTLAGDGPDFEAFKLIIADMMGDKVRIINPNLHVTALEVIPVPQPIQAPKLISEVSTGDVPPQSIPLDSYKKSIAPIVDRKVFEKANTEVSKKLPERVH